VDDDTDARDLLKTTLEQAGANVRVAASAPEALDLFTQRIPDLLVSDVGMPIIDGCALMRDIRCLPEREGGKVTAVAVTAYARATDRERALAAGFDMFFAKPFLVSEFLGALAALVGRAQTP
jgi:CheY-like chemotaxis protein